MARIWVPTEPLATTLAGLPGATVDVVVPDGGLAAGQRGRGGVLRSAVLP